MHLNVFVPLLLEAFGNRWFETGTISQDFRIGTLDREEVRAVVAEPPAGAADVQVAAHLERRDGDVVSIGTASAGRPAEPTWLGRRDLRAFDSGPYSLTANVKPGDQFGVREIVLSESAAERMIGEAAPLPWYLSGSPWGPPIASPSLMVNALGSACSLYLREHRLSGVSIDGATELRNINGPIFLGQTYHASGEVLARGRSPKTEYFWYEGRLDDESGRRIAEMVLQWRLVAGSGDRV